MAPSAIGIMVKPACVGLKPSATCKKSGSQKRDKCATAQTRNPDAGDPDAETGYSEQGPTEQGMWVALAVPEVGIQGEQARNRQ